MKLKQTMSIAILGVLAVLTGCQEAPVNYPSDYRGIQLNPSRASLQDILRAEISKQSKLSGTSLKLRSLTAFDWDKVYIFPPYTSVDEIQKSLGFPWKAAESSRIFEREDISLLVFVKRNQVVQYLAYPRSKGDFADIKALNGLTPDQAAFAIAISADSRLLVRLSSDCEKNAQTTSSQSVQSPSRQSSTKPSTFCAIDNVKK
ncbi:hypothetical protein TUMEXPCC7403_04390 [Tumidithrix helvetica PCC 7403]|uniref:hypothetical protein n=1 Tax=Tumidithrix helvetica TaxID=3457545 RepID=UPI003C87C387